MVKYDALIHDRKFFEPAHIKERQELYKFTQAVKVETFLWDLELYGQLQRALGDQVVLKGGAAAQLFIPTERQRTSVDIDVIYLGTKDRLEEALTKIHKDFGEDEVYFKFNKHTPKNPKTILPLETYFVPIPAAINADSTSNIKVDFHLMESLGLEVREVENAAAFVIPLGFNPICLSPASLLGDKLLTLAQGSVGIPPDREDDIVKQLYDLEYLTKNVNSEDTSAMNLAMTTLFEREIAHRSEKVGLDQAHQDSIRLLERYSTVNSPKPDELARTATRNFRGNYEPKPFRSSMDWEVTAKRLQFLVRCIASNPEQALVNLKEADEIEARIELKGNERRIEIRQALSEDFVTLLRGEHRMETAKRLKNTSPERLLWEVLRPSRLSDIQSLITPRATSA